MDLVLGLALSVHLGLQGDYNALHPNIGIEHNNYIAGAYYNSEYNISPYIGYRFDISKNVNIEAGVVGGYTTGAMLPLVKFNYNRFFIAPAYEKYNGERVGIVAGIEYKI